MSLKKVTALLLAFLMLFGAAPMAALAANDNDTAEELRAVSVQIHVRPAVMTEAVTEAAPGLTKPCLKHRVSFALLILHS